MSLSIPALTPVQVLFISCVAYTCISTPILSYFFYRFYKNQEAWNCFWAGDGETLVIEAGENYTTIKREKEKPEGVLKGDSDLEDWSFFTRPVPLGNVENPEDIDIDQEVREYRRKAERAGYEWSQEIGDRVRERLEEYKQDLAKESDDLLKAVKFVNKLVQPSIMKGSRRPVVIRQSSKAVTTSLKAAAAATHIEGIAEYLNIDPRSLMTAFTNMISPSQVLYVAFRNQLIGAERLKEKPSILFIIIVLILLIGGLLGLTKFFGLW